MRAILVCLCLAVLFGCKGNDSNAVIGSGRKETASNAHTGWKEVTVSGISTSFPPTWVVWDLTRKDFDQIVSAAEKDPKIAPMAAAAKQMAASGVLKLIILDKENATPTFVNNANLLVTDNPGNASLESVIAQNETQLAAMSSSPVKKETLELPVGKTGYLESEIKNQNGTPVTAMTYVVPHDTHLYVFTFSATPADKERFRKSADEIMKTVKF